MKRIAVRQDSGEHGVAAFVIRGGTLFFCIEHKAFATGAKNHSVARIFKVDSLDVRRTAANCKQCCFVNKVRQVGAAHAGSCAGHGVEIDVLSHALSGGVHLQNGKALVGLWQRNDDLAIEAAWSEKCGVQNVGAVSCCKNNNSFCCFEAVHFCQQLIERLFTLIVSAAKPGTTLATNRIDLINKDDCAPHFRCLLEEVANTACADTDKHFHEVGTSYRHKANACFTGNRAGKQCLAGTWRAYEQNSFGYSGADFFEALWHPKEVDDFFNFLFHALVSGNVGKRGAWIVGVVVLRAATAD